MRNITHAWPNFGICQLHRDVCRSIGINKPWTIPKKVIGFTFYVFFKPYNIAFVQSLRLRPS
jgi:hypothetical protein